ncbi:hypothetical protein [Austwickia chelonae]|uniref:hypothetical protein n=1 Tax=Austwickia chelonae TaxID=100225 RepID=UPI000E24B848|nr:hypothetical protein [Austwickia chelonae]
MGLAGRIDTGRAAEITAHLVSAVACVMASVTAGGTSWLCINALVPVVYGVALWAAYAPTATREQADPLSDSLFESLIRLTATAALCFGVHWYRPTGGILGIFQLYFLAQILLATACTVPGKTRAGQHRADPAPAAC